MLSARRVGEWLGAYWFPTFILVFRWQFAYLTIAIRAFYLAKGQWRGWPQSVAAAFLFYVLNSAS